MNYIDSANIELLIAKDLSQFAEKAALIFVERAKESISERGQFVVALSGGKTPARVLDVLAHKYHDACEWEKIHFFWSDERMVPADHERSNFHMSKIHLLDKIKIPAENIHRVLTENSSDQAAKLYDEVLHRWSPFDLIFLGLGEDGHTASLFPETPALMNDHDLVVSNKGPNLPDTRITFTYLVINNAKMVIVLISGAEKSEIVRSALMTTPNYLKLPIQGVHLKEGRLLWVLDKAALGGLSLPH